MERRGRSGRRQRLLPRHLLVYAGPGKARHPGRRQGCFAAGRRSHDRRRLPERGKAGRAQGRLLHLPGGPDRPPQRGKSAGNFRGQQRQRHRVSPESRFYLLRRHLPGCDPAYRPGRALCPARSWRTGTEGDPHRHRPRCQDRRGHRGSRRGGRTERDLCTGGSDPHRSGGKGHRKGCFHAEQRPSVGWRGRSLPLHRICQAGQWRGDLRPVRLPQV